MNNFDTKQVFKKVFKEIILNEMSEKEIIDLNNKIMIEEINLYRFKVKDFKKFEEESVMRKIIELIYSKINDKKVVAKFIEEEKEVDCADIIFESFSNLNVEEFYEKMVELFNIFYDKNSLNYESKEF